MTTQPAVQKKEHPDSKLRSLLIQFLSEGDADVLNVCYRLPSCKTLQPFLHTDARRSAEICEGKAQLIVGRRSKFGDLPSLASTWGFCMTVVQVALKVAYREKPDLLLEKIDVLQTNEVTDELRNKLGINPSEPDYDAEYRKGATSALAGTCLELWDQSTPDTPPSVTATDHVTSPTGAELMTVDGSTAGDPAASGVTSVNGAGDFFSNRQTEPTVNDAGVAFATTEEPEPSIDGSNEDGKGKRKRISTEGARQRQQRRKPSIAPATMSFTRESSA
jgi:hypothetical protein